MLVIVIKIRLSDLKDSMPSQEPQRNDTFQKRKQKIVEGKYKRRKIKTQNHRPTPLGKKKNQFLVMKNEEHNKARDKRG